MQDDFVTHEGFIQTIYSSKLLIYHSLDALGLIPFILEAQVEHCVKALVDYFRKEVPVIESNYSWKIPQVSGFMLSGHSGYKANVELKKYFNRIWLNSDYERRQALSKVVVADWGGVRANNFETLKSYVDELYKDCPQTPLKGIASYSKIFSIADMHKYAIYDARVAACLNAVQCNQGVSSGLAFNYISGRNNIVGHSGKKEGFVYHDKFKVKSLIDSGWKKIKRDDTYEVYLNILKECLRVLPTYKLYDLEMVLFANAKSECEKAMKYVIK